MDAERLLAGITTSLMAVRADMAVASHVKGDLDDDSLAFVVAVAQTARARHILEVGTGRGRTSVAWAANTNATIITIDRPAKHRNPPAVIDYGTDELYYHFADDEGDLIATYPGSRRIVRVRHESQTQAAHSLVDAALAGASIDVALIDGAHSFDAVKSDFEDLVLPRLASGGIVLFDDFARLETHVGVTHYLTSKAYTDGYLFYWIRDPDLYSNLAAFINFPEALNRQWRAL